MNANLLTGRLAALLLGGLFKVGTAAVQKDLNIRWCSGEPAGEKALKSLAAGR